MSGLPGHGARRQEHGAFHRGVVHAGDRKAHHQSREQPLSRVGVAKGEPERHDRGADRDQDREHNPSGIVLDEGRHSHRGHAGIVHAGDTKSHREAGCEERLWASSDNGKGGSGDDNRNDQRKESQEWIVRDLDSGQAEGQHADEMHGPDAAAHGDRSGHQPAIQF